MDGMLWIAVLGTVMLAVSATFWNSQGWPNLILKITMAATAALMALHTAGEMVIQGVLQ